MTSASIMEMQSAGFVSSANAVKSSATGNAVQFSEAMQFAQTEQQDNSAEVVRGDEVKTHAEKSATEYGGRKEIKEAEPVEAQKEVESEQVSEELDAKEEAVVEEIAKELGVSEEAVQEALEILGLSVMDLMVQGNMAALTAQLTGMQVVDVLTDENLFAQITELTQNVVSEFQALADELGISVEQLQTMVEQQVSEQQSFSQQVVVEEPAVVTEVAEEFVVAQEVTEHEGKAVVVQETTEESDVEQQVVSKVTEEVPKENEFGSNTEEESSFAQSSQMAQQDVKTVAPEKAVAAEFEQRFDLQQTREMIEQISDYVRIHHTERVSAMEIQLHPVELGTVNLQVVAKDGTISAQLSVQDEAVRAALESQIMQLRESLQAQGLKIDAVEVTVATHEFEQNLDQHGKDAEENAAKEKKNSRRILDLDEIGQEDLEDMEISDAERLQIEMMRMGGNRLNFRV